MSFIDPTYLRYVVERIKDGEFTNEKSSTLPDGVIGLYSFITPLESSVCDRQRVLEFFSFWALMKKEITLDLASICLGWDLNLIKDYIARYSNWFNIVSSNQYILYHQKLSIYILQKASYGQIKKHIDSLNRLELPVILQNNLSQFINQHNYSLAYHDQLYETKCIKYLSSISKDENLTNVTNQLNITAYRQVAALYGYKNNLRGLSQLYLDFDNYNRLEIDIDNDFKQFKSKGAFHIANKSDLISSIEYSTVYLIYFIDKILSSDRNDQNSLNYLVQKLNGKILDLGSGHYPLMTPEYIIYLNTQLQAIGCSQINYKPETVELPYYMSEDGHGGLMNENALIYFDSTNLRYDEIITELSNSFNRIEAIAQSDANAKKISEKLFQLSKNHEINAIEQFIINIREKTLRGSADSYDDLGNYDDYLFKLFKLVHHFNENYGYGKWVKFFISSLMSWRQNMSFWMMLKKAHVRGEVSGIYRRYDLPETPICKKAGYMRDEMTTLMYVLGLSNRYDQIQILLAEYLKNSYGILEYNVYTDMLAAECIRPTRNTKRITEINNYFDKNEIAFYLNYAFQLSNVLCEEIEFLELISFLLVNPNEQSEISSNYQWTCEVIDGIMSRVSNDSFINYVLIGFKKYIEVMGGYGIDDHPLDIDLPSENIWKIEWWIMTNFFCAVCEKIKSSEVLLKKFNDSIAAFYEEFNADSRINLLEGVNRYNSFRKMHVLQQASPEYKIHSNPIHFLKSFNSILDDKVLLQKLTGSICARTLAWN